jgi:hypothetical protein
MEMRESNCSAGFVTRSLSARHLFRTVLKASEAAAMLSNADTLPA